MGVKLEAPAVGIVHQDQRGAVICRKIAGADVLAIAAEVGDRQRLLVEDADEAGRPAAVLDIGPAALRDGRHIEAVAFGDERDFGWSEPIEGAVAVETRPEFAAAIGLLRGAHAGRRGDIEKSIRHGSPPILVGPWASKPNIVGFILLNNLAQLEDNLSVVGIWTASKPCPF